ncbi:MAG: pyridoxamine 5'-phosphate oxidase [Campylobacterota bacterium]|nr:pyridoxamine 5'-phosphate oxidase [Campylobacterota bacterium]
MNFIRADYDYIERGLERKDLDADPMNQFEVWLDQAIELELIESNAMSLATVSKSGTPSIRSVLLKSYDKDGFLFFANTQSKKVEDIKHNAQVALHFAWLGLERQVKIEGQAKQLSSSALFKTILTRPKGIHQGEWIPNQNSSVSFRSLYETQFDAMKSKFLSGQIPFPNLWYAYRVKPLVMEFWQGGKDRLHDRFEYRLLEGSWKIERLSS